VIFLIIIRIIIFLIIRVIKLKILKYELQHATGNDTLQKHATDSDTLQKCATDSGALQKYATNSYVFNIFYFLIIINRAHTSALVGVSCSPTDT
jgi:hypothetical protein